MRLDVGIGVPGGSDSDDAQVVEALRQGAQIGSMLARMRFDYPDQMLARVATDNDDGTYDCDRPGTLIYMSAVPVASIALAVHIVVGATVLIKFYKRDRRKPRIVAVAGGLGPEEALIGWLQGQANSSLRFSADSPTIALDAASSVLLDPTADAVLGIVVKDQLVYYAYQKANIWHVASAEWDLSLPGTHSAYDAGKDFRLGYLFATGPGLVVIDPVTLQAHTVSYDGQLADSKLVRAALHCSVVGIMTRILVLEGWHSEVSPTVRGYFLGGGSDWSWTPSDAEPESITAGQIARTGNLIHYFNGSNVPTVGEGRWPILEDTVSLWVSGWEDMEDTESARLIQQSVDYTYSVAQIGLSTVQPSRVCWGAGVQLSALTGVLQARDEEVFDAESLLQTDAATVNYWSTQLTAKPGRAIMLENKYYAEYLDLFSTVVGRFIYGGAADALALDRIPAFTIQHYIDDNPANPITTSSARYQHVMGTAAVFGDPRPEASDFKRPELYYFVVPHVPLQPGKVVNLERGSPTYPDGEDILDCPESPSTAREDAPHQILAEEGGITYRCIRKPLLYRLGSAECLPVFDSDTEVVSGMVIGYDADGNAVTTTTRGIEITWKIWQVGKIAQSWQTVLQCLKNGAVLWEKDISQYFEATYRGARL